MLNLKPQQKTPDWTEFSPFFFVIPTQSYLFLFFHEMDGDDKTVRFEKEVCTMKKIVALYTEVEQYIACGNEPFQRDVLVVWTFKFGKNCPRRFFLFVQAPLLLKRSFQRPVRLQILGGMALAIS